MPPWRLATLRLLPVFCLLGSCAALDNVGGAAVEVGAAHAKLIAAYNTCNEGDFTSSYSQEFTFTTSNTRQAHSTLETLRSYLASGCRQSPSPQVTLKGQVVRLVGPLALLTGQYVFRITSQGVTREVTQNFTAVLRHESGAWRVAAHHVSLAP